MKKKKYHPSGIDGSPKVWVGVETFFILDGILKIHLKIDFCQNTNTEKTYNILHTILDESKNKKFCAK